MTLLVAGFLLLVIAGIVFSINYMNWSNIVSQAETALDLLARNSGERPGLQFEAIQKPPEISINAGDAGAGRDPAGPDGHREDLKKPDSTGHNPGQPPDSENALASLSNYYVITIDDGMNIAEWSSDRADLYTDEQIEEITSAVLSSGKESGHVGTQFFRLISGHPSSDSQMLIVLDQRLEIMSMRRILRSTLFIAGLAYVLLCTAAWLLIRSMIRPVQEAFDKQRQFVWDAGHELKTPLAVIGANAQVLEEEIGGNEYLGYITSEVKRSNNLLTSLLTLARMDRKTAPAVMKELDLGKTVLAVALPFESAVYEAGKKLELDAVENIRCRGDEALLQQLTVILLSNALKYSDDHGTITVKTGRKGRYAVLSVSNTGSGISPEDMRHIFDRFYRADAAHSRDTEGFGLGLSIAAGIAEAHHGKIRCESAADGRTTFSVLLP